MICVDGTPHLKVAFRRVSDSHHQVWHRKADHGSKQSLFLCNGLHITRMNICVVSPRMGMKQGKHVRKEVITILSEEVNDAVEWDTVFLRVLF